MSWMEALYQTYENVKETYLGQQMNRTSLLPICHTSKKAHVHVVLDMDGRIRDASVVPKEEAETIIPGTEQSIGRTGKKPPPHPLFDKLQYLAGDYEKYGGKKFFDHESYLSQLGAWCDSPYGFPSLRAVHRYLSQGTLIGDLIELGVLHVGPDGKLLTKWTDREQPKPDIFVLPTSQLDAFVRFSVEEPGTPQSKLWEDESIRQSWIEYAQNDDAETGLCFVTGKKAPLATNHPKRIRYGGDGAKLISVNGKCAFTFLGKFTDASQVCGVSQDVTQKAHSALRWLIARQGMVDNGLAVVAWAVSGKPVPSPCAGTDWLAEAWEPDLPHDGGEAVGLRFRNKIAGFRADLGDADRVMVMALDAASKGRMAIKYYRELRGSEYLERVESWHKDCAWEIEPVKGKKFVGAPSPRIIAESVYGSREDEKTKERKVVGGFSKNTIERLLPCIVDGAPLPWDLVVSCVRRACNRAALDPDEWEMVLGVACALYRYFNKGRYDMSLDNERRTRDYLYGRLLAIADHVEHVALTDSEKKRSTNAARMMQRFAARPYDTWRNVALNLQPYEDRLSANKPGLMFWLSKELEKVYALFVPEDFIDDRALSGEFLLGFYCQRSALWTTKDDSSSESEEA